MLATTKRGGRRPPHLLTHGLACAGLRLGLGLGVGVGVGVGLAIPNPNPNLNPNPNPKPNPNQDFGNFQDLEATARQKEERKQG